MTMDSAILKLIKLSLLSALLLAGCASTDQPTVNTNSTISLMNVKLPSKIWDMPGVTAHSLDVAFGGNCSTYAKKNEHINYIYGKVQSLAQKDLWTMFDQELVKNNSYSRVEQRKGRGFMNTKFRQATKQTGIRLDYFERPDVIFCKTKSSSARRNVKDLLGFKKDFEFRDENITLVYLITGEIVEFKVDRYYDSSTYSGKQNAKLFLRKGDEYLDQFPNTNTHGRYRVGWARYEYENGYACSVTKKSIKCKIDDEMMYKSLTDSSYEAKLEEYVNATYDAIGSR